MDKKADRIIKYAILLSYILFNLYMLINHELWRDEANVWLMARELSPEELIREIHYQGHPCLWYLIVMPFAKLGLPFKTISVLSFAVMATAAALVTCKAPFHNILKLLLLISPVFSYYYPVVARNYCLIALLLVLAAYYHPLRHEKPLLYGLLLGLLIQADTIAFATAGMLSVYLLYEAVKSKSYKNALISLCIPILSLIFWYVQFRNVAESPEYSAGAMERGEFIKNLKYELIYITGRLSGLNETRSTVLILLFILAGVLTALFTKDAFPLFVTAVSYLFEGVFSVIVYGLHIWHFIMLVFVLIWALWIYGFKCGTGTSKKTGFAYVFCEVLLGLLAIFMFIRWNSAEESSSLKNALTGVYSDGKGAADFIKANISPDELIIDTDVAMCSTVQAYLGKAYSFYYAGTMKRETYADYTEEQSRNIRYDNLLNLIRNNFEKKESFYIIIGGGSCITDVSTEDMEAWKLIYETGMETARGEEYLIYRVTP